MKAWTKLWQMTALALTLCLSLGAQAAESARTYNVVSGDTLDKVIRQTMGDSPFKIEVLRQAFIQQNPQAFTKGSPKFLMAGAVLKVPNQEDVLRRMAGVNAKPVYGPDPGMMERKNWVRYP
jgi:Tfp pilus assembly protein FimV